MALQFGFRIREFMWDPLAGVVVLSSFLADGSAVYSRKQSGDEDIDSVPLFMAHGMRDDLVPISWGEATFNLLSMGEHTRPEVSCFRTFDGYHNIDNKIMDSVGNWISDRFI